MMKITSKTIAMKVQRKFPMNFGIFAMNPNTIFFGIVHVNIIFSTENIEEYSFHLFYQIFSDHTNPFLCEKLPDIDIQRVVRDCFLAVTPRNDICFTKFSREILNLVSADFIVQIFKMANEFTHDDFNPDYRGSMSDSVESEENEGESESGDLCDSHESEDSCDSQMVMKKKTKNLSEKLFFIPH